MLGGLSGNYFAMLAPEAWASHILSAHSIKPCTLYQPFFLSQNYSSETPGSSEQDNININSIDISYRGQLVLHDVFSD